MEAYIDGSGWNGRESRTAVLVQGSPLIDTYGEHTNNEMEYQALITCLDSFKADTIYTDSQLLVGHLTRGWKVKALNLVPYYKKAKELLKSTNLVWVPRDENLAGKLLE